jgi:carbon-monoxide dehydrogenase medium subunit
LDNLPKNRIIENNCAQKGLVKMKFEYHQPESLEAAIKLLVGYGPAAALLAGGTALLVDMRNGELSPGHLVSLWDIPGLAEIRFNGELRLGALATVTELAEAVVGRPPLQGLAEAARQVGGRQIQNMATVGGNICKASPGADLVPPLLCLDATLAIFGPQGERHTPLDGFLTGPDQTALQPGEILTGIDIPPPIPGTGTAFLKVMRRQAVDCSIVAVAARVSLAEDGKTCREARIAVGAAGPNPFRAKQAEAELTAQELTPETVQAAARQAQAEARPIDDVRASAGYRRRLVNILVERAILAAAERANQGGNR